MTQKYKKIQENLNFINISTEEFSLFEWKPLSSHKSFILDLNIVNTLNRTESILFGFNANILTSTQLDRRTEITFGTNLNLNSIKQLIAGVDINFSIDLNLQLVNFLQKLEFIPYNIYFIEKDPRELKLYKGSRDCFISIEDRNIIIHYQNRTYIVPIKKD